ncbi:conserved protein [Gluconacetobacter diazotrophicus PA1 5]|uniref:Conserved protein n=1 Tax=Gluconacetobacter diazotrophicus (strain ATCC 49037 / DSM 5601 / CCUG 37298 / CIP 103539 / LMG 7603 / PAl5) TaxID=272568 RepID=A9H0G7_GLUDA|nr:conserved protein [Gluconacetobacter diazotrophicus PA1 5]
MGRTARWSVSRVLSTFDEGGRPFLWDAPCGAPHATNPNDGGGGTPDDPARGGPSAVPIRSCSRWGLPCRLRYRTRGALLPHRFTLTRTISGEPECRGGGLFSVALSLGSPPPAVSRHRSSVEPGLSSTAWEIHATAAARPSGLRKLNDLSGLRQGGMRRIKKRQMEARTWMSDRRGGPRPDWRRGCCCGT